jgi:hypothetical protein
MRDENGESTSKSGGRGPNTISGSRSWNGRSGWGELEAVGVGKHHPSGAEPLSLQAVPRSSPGCDPAHRGSSGRRPSDPLAAQDREAWAAHSGPIKIVRQPIEMCMVFIGTWSLVSMGWDCRGAAPSSREASGGLST